MFKIKSKKMQKNKWKKLTKSISKFKIKINKKT